MAETITATITEITIGGERIDRAFLYPDPSAPIRREQVLAVLEGHRVADRRCVAHMPDDIAAMLVGYSGPRHLVVGQVEQHLEALVADGLAITVVMGGITHYRRRGTIAGVRVEFEPGDHVPASHVFRPSSLALPSPVIFGRGMFGQAEAEHFAWVLTFALAHAGDRWRPISYREISETIRAQLDNSAELRAAAGNQFFRPDARSLVDRGWAVEDAQHRLAFTMPALVRLAASPWVA